MPGGRNTDLTEKVIKQIADNVRSGDLFHIACKKAGIPENTAHQWMMRGRNVHPDPLKTSVDKHGNNIFEQFVNAIELAEAEAENKLLGIIEQSAEAHKKVTTKVIKYANGDVQEEVTTAVEPNPQSAKTLLAWRNPEKYAAKSDFSKALITLAAYGLKVYMDTDGNWQIKDETNDVNVKKIPKRDKAKLTDQNGENSY